MDASTPAFTKENIEKALHQLYYEPSVDLKDAAQHWLTKAQRSAEAWQFSWELLDQNKATEVQYFGASALINKISSFWTDIPNSEVMVLRNRLFEEILKFCALKEKKIVLTRLCVAFSSFLANCAINQLWPTAIQDTIEKFQINEKQGVGEESRCYALLEILLILAEEFHSSRLEKYKKGLILNLLKSGHPQVLDLLVRIFQSSTDKSIQGQVIKCLSSWVILGIPLTECADLLVSVFQCAKDPELFEPSVECMLNTFCSPASQDYSNTIKKFMPLLASLEPTLQQAISDQDAERILGLTKVICSFAENFSSLIIKTLAESNCSLVILKLILQCSGVPLQYPTEEFSSPISFTCWCSLQDDIEALPLPERSVACQYLNPYFFELINCFLSKARYPKGNSFNDWSAEEKEQHRIYRVDIADTFTYILEMFGDKLFAHVFNKFISLQTATPNAETHWHDVEVCLYAIHSIIESLMAYSVEIPGLETLVDLLPSIQVESLLLADTLLYTIGTLTEWLNTHPGKVLPLVSFVLSSLSNQELALSAVLTVRRLVRECSNDLLPFSSDIMQHFTSLFIGGTLQRTVEVWLMQAAGHMLSEMPRDACMEHLEKLLNMQLHQLEALSKDSRSAPNKSSIMHILDLLANLFCTLDRREENSEGEMLAREKEEQPAILILNKLNPIFQNILNTWVTERDVVKSICDMYDKAIRSLVGDFAPVLAQVNEILCAIFRSYPYACVLGLCQQIVLVFGIEQLHIEAVSQLLHVMLTTVIAMYENGSIRNHPDTAQDFMRLVGHVAKKRNALLKLQQDKNPSFLADLFKCALMTLQHAEYESLLTSATFVVDFAALYPEYPEVARVIDTFAKELLQIALQAIGGASPRTTMDRFADILYATAQANFGLFRINVNELMSLPNVPNATLDAGRKNTFLKQLLRDVKKRQKCRDIVKEFTLICRGLYGTEYAGK